MTDVTCTRRLHFCAGHRVAGHESKCANLHGHNYVVLITANAVNLDKVGRVIDFSVIKEHVGGWLDREWDHRFLLWNEDTRLSPDPAHLGIVRVPFNPTAENMAQYLFKLSNTLLNPLGVAVNHVRIWETENCYADAYLPAPKPMWAQEHE